MSSCLRRCSCCGSTIPANAPAWVDSCARLADWRQYREAGAVPDPRRASDLLTIPGLCRLVGRIRGRVQ